MVDLQQLIPTSRQKAYVTSDKGPSDDAGSSALLELLLRNTIDGGVERRRIAPPVTLHRGRARHKKGFTVDLYHCV